MELERFNGLDAVAAADVVRVWAAIPSWVDAVVASRPFASIAQLEQTARAEALLWSADDLDVALAHHPRIGQRPSGAGAEADASRREQAAMATASEAIAAQLVVGNRAYEERFGRVFLIRAAGRSPEEMLAHLQRRLAADDATETAEALGQLGEIALLRIRQSLTEETS